VGVGDSEAPESSKEISAVKFSKNASIRSYKVFRENLTSCFNYVAKCYNFNRITTACGCHVTWPEIRLPYLDKKIVIDLQNYEYRYDKCDERPSPSIIIPVLFYLASNKSNKISEKWVNYAQLDSGLFYSKTIRPQIIDPLLINFKSNPNEFINALKSLGGIKEPFKDISFSLWPLPYFPILFIARYPDSEFDFDLNILFDNTSCDHLSIDNIKTLTIAVKSEIIARNIKLINSSKKVYRDSGNTEL
jgi:hypothetical protein